ncbi:hypothetical protein LZ31DRAFT_45881 [Colletotrichum somersetense]|nr:hypothetical protein LZ31DRAFT_45881 [Colletotrichum somersetense]
MPARPRARPRRPRLTPPPLTPPRPPMRLDGLPRATAGRLSRRRVTPTMTIRRPWKTLRRLTHTRADVPSGPNPETLMTRTMMMTRMKMRMMRTTKATDSPKRDATEAKPASARSLRQSTPTRLSS